MNKENTRIEQLYTKCLSQGAYYIESQGEVAIIDPLRETQPYIDKAKANNARITYIFETHVHADFVSGHVDLAEKTGATIVFGPGAGTTYESYEAIDGEVFNVGDLKIKVIHTPGHTLESVTYLLIDAEGKNHAIFTGDTLFLGDVGRPDLLASSGYSEKDLAGLLFDSLRNKIMPLEDNLLVYPAHGAGSACGKNLSRETIGILGEQKSNNYALRADMSKTEFISALLEGIAPAPKYFKENVKMNLTGYPSIDKLLKDGNKPLSISEFKNAYKKQNALILDVRTQSEYIKSHIPGSLFIGLNGQFAPWVGALVQPIDIPILLVVPDHQIVEAITRLARVGYDNVLGYLSGGYDEWRTAGEETSTLKSISAENFETILTPNFKGQILDVRKPSEFNTNHVNHPNLKHLPLSEIQKEVGLLNAGETYYIYCGGGYRSVIAASLLQSKETFNLVDIAGGFAALKKTAIAMRGKECSAH